MRKFVIFDTDKIICKNSKSLIVLFQDDNNKTNTIICGNSNEIMQLLKGVNND